MSTPAFTLRGIYSAQWIPIDAAGKIDRAALAAHLNFERACGIHGVLALGSTGCFPYLEMDERKAVLGTVAELAGALPVIANITDLRPKTAVELGRFAKRLGLPAVALMAPVFYPVSQADMLAYFLHVAEAVDLPVMLYNFPELTGKRIELETVAAFADRTPMCGIKQSGREISYHEPLIQLAREKHFAVMSGADTRLPEVFALGAAGCIGGLVNLVPELMLHVYRICAEHRSGAVEEAAARLTEVGRIIDQLTFPLNIAAGLEARGVPPGTPRSILSSESRLLHDHVVHELRARFAAWELAPVDCAIA